MTFATKSVALPSDPSQLKTTLMTTSAVFPQKVLIEGSWVKCAATTTASTASVTSTGTTTTAATAVTAATAATAATAVTKPSYFLLKWKSKVS